MAWEVEYTDEFAVWWDTLDDVRREDVAAYVGELERLGPRLPFPYSSGVKSSRHAHMRELRVQSGGHPLRVFYAFDPRRAAILLLGGDKTGDDLFYQRMVPQVDTLYDIHLEELRKENHHGR